MGIYICLLSFEIILGYIFKVNENKLNKKIYMCITFILLALIAGLRTKNVGIDTNQFCNAYKRIGNETITYALSRERYEIGFTCLCYYLNFITSDPQLLIFLTSIFINFSIVRFIYKNSEDVIFSIFLYLTLNFYFSYMNIMRQAIAIAILLYAFENLKQKKYIRYFMELVIATLFHFTAILGILYFIAQKFNYKRKYNKLVIPLLVGIFIYGKKILNTLAEISSRLLEYIGGKYDVSNYFGSMLAMLVSATILFFGISILKNKSRKEVQNLMFYQKMLIIGVIFNTLTMRVNIFNRFTPYFSIFQIIWLPNIFKLMKKNKLQYILISSIFFILYWIIIMIYRPEWYGAVPYKMMQIR